MIFNVQLFLAIGFSCAAFAMLQARAADVELAPNIEERARFGLIYDTQKQFEGIVGMIGPRGVLNIERDREATFVLAPAFEDRWLIRLESYAVESPDQLDASAPPDLSVTRSSYAVLDDYAQAGLPDEVVRHTRMTNDNYLKQISQAEFDQAFRIVSAAIADETVVSDPISGCDDGVVFFAEVAVAETRKLISRHNCDDDYKAVLEELHPFFELAASKINPVASDLRRIWKTETGD